MTTVTKSLITNFGGSISGLNSGQLMIEIQASPGITPNITNITTDDDVVTLHFDATVPIEELTTINTVISAHTPLNIGSKVDSVPININDVNYTTYTRLISFNYPGTSQYKNTTHMKISSSMDIGGTSYLIRVYDLTNNNVICSATLNNEDAEIIDLGTLANLPTSIAIFEVQAKVTGTTTADIIGLNIYHD